MRKELLLASVVVVALVLVSIQFLLPRMFEGSEPRAQVQAQSHSIAGSGSSDKPSPPFMRKPGYVYRAVKRDDPFLSPIDGEKESNPYVGLLEVEGARLVGIADSRDGKLALFEDSDGVGYVLRHGDRVQNGKVTQITGTTVKIVRNVYGEIQRLTFRLRPKGEVHG